MRVVKLASKKGKDLEDVVKINYLKLMKREILVEIWLKSTDDDHKEETNQTR